MGVRSAEMYFILRLLATILFMLVMFVFGCGYCLLSPRNPKHVYTIGRQFGRLSRLFGIQLELRQSEASKSVEKGVYIANHQSNWDMVTVSNAIRLVLSPWVKKVSLIFHFLARFTGWQVTF